MTWVNFGDILETIKMAYMLDRFHQEKGGGLEEFLVYFQKRILETLDLALAASP